MSSPRFPFSQIGHAPPTPANGTFAPRDNFALYRVLAVYWQSPFGGLYNVWFTGCFEPNTRVLHPSTTVPPSLHFRLQSFCPRALLPTLLARLQACLWFTMRAVYPRPVKTKGRCKIAVTCDVKRPRARRLGEMGFAQHLATVAVIFHSGSVSARDLEKQIRGQLCIAFTP